jgi:hypothetical protein
MPHMPDIEPPSRLTPVDVVFLSNVEIRAVLTHLAGHPDPAVSEAVVEATEKVLERTRGQQ